MCKDCFDSIDEVTGFFKEDYEDFFDDMAFQLKERYKDQPDDCLPMGMILGVNLVDYCLDEFKNGIQYRVHTDSPKQETLEALEAAELSCKEFLEFAAETKKRLNTHEEEAQ